MSNFTKIAYALLFMTLIAQPHFTDHIHMWFVPKPYIESLVTLIVFGLAYLVYYLHIQETKKNKMLAKDLRISQEKLLDSFKYIGSINTRLPLLKHLSSELLAGSKNTERHKKTIFDNLLATAIVSIAKVDWGLLRFVEMKNQRTAKEFIYANGDYILLTHRVGNRALSLSRKQNANIKTLGEFQVVPTSDEETAIQGFLILPRAEVNLTDEYSFLQAVVDQAQLFYKYLFA